MQNILLAFTLLLAAAPLGATPVQNHVSGSFEVEIVPTESTSAMGVATSRLAVTKHFSGGLIAESKGEMLTAAGGEAGSAAYVLIERVSGTLDGKAGSFALAHLGLMDRGTPDLRIAIVPGSGGGALTGITGSLVIRIDGKQHFYDLDYSLPTR
jgi:hypothetical protein